MFGFGKKTIPISEYGLWVLKYSDDFVSGDAARSLGSRFPNYDASRGWVPVFEQNGVPISLAKLYLRIYTHCVLQTVFKGHTSLHRRTMVQGAISGIADTPAGYNFSKTFDELEAAFEGSYKFDSKVEPLNNTDARLPFMAYPNVGILASKYLIDSFIIPNMVNRQAYIDDFKSYSMAFGSAVATAHRASEQILLKVKLAP